MAATYSSLLGLAVGGKYEIRRVLGIGGMGVVCEAVNTDLRKRVALKLIDKSMKESELIVERFRREARAAGQIQSEHIVDVFDMGADARVGLYMVMEHLVGEDLQTRIDRDGRVDVSTAVMLGHQIARGLAKAHAAGVIHRDLKPANVFLTSRDNGQLLVKILDFGVSKLLADEPANARITGTGAPIGTPLYMSPEQAEGKEDVDGRADIWSLGAVMYEALSGQPPFQDRGSYHGTIVGILTSRPRPLKAVAPWVPTPIAAVVDGMLVHDREARIRDASTVSQRLLDAYPTVLPDGTGRHTAVIVSQATAAIDATGDTEIFTSASVPPLETGEGSAARASAPSSPAAGDSHRTVPDAPWAPDASDAADHRAALDVASVADAGAERARHASGISPQKGPRTEPLLLPTPSSAAGGVSLPATPAEIPPLTEHSPDTVRDAELARRAELPRYLALAAILATVAAFSVAGFYLGRHASGTAPPPPTTGAPTPDTTAPPATEPPRATTGAVTAPTTTGPAATAPAPPAVSLDTLPNAANAAHTATIGSAEPRHPAPGAPPRKRAPRPPPDTTTTHDDRPSSATTGTPREEEPAPATEPGAPAAP